MIFGEGYQSRLELNGFEHAPAVDAQKICRTRAAELRRVLYTIWPVVQKSLGEVSAKTFEERCGVASDDPRFPVYLGRRVEDHIYQQVALWKEGQRPSPDQIPLIMKFFHYDSRQAYDDPLAFVQRREQEHPRTAPELQGIISEEALAAEIVNPTRPETDEWH